MLERGQMVAEFLAKGHGFSSQGEFGQARREYRTVLALHPDNVDAYLGLAYLSFMQGQWELSLAHYLRASQLNPNSADVHYGLGRVYLELERVDEAIAEFQKTLTLEPSFEDARDSLTSIGQAV